MPQVCRLLHCQVDRKSNCLILFQTHGSISIKENKTIKCENNNIEIKSQQFTMIKMFTNICANVSKSKRSPFVSPCVRSVSFLQLNRRAAMFLQRHQDMFVHKIHIQTGGSRFLYCDDFEHKSCMMSLPQNRYLWVFSF